MSSQSPRKLVKMIFSSRTGLPLPHPLLFFVEISTSIPSLNVIEVLAVLTLLINS